ncbi:hypothetical protein [Tateyamaria sp.]|uniref:hypothetical protein n=1 Tax=Tateyamaria sp. TaxID=1929288 RepID=UPI00329B0267
MSYVQPNFNKRVSALGRKHEAMTYGYKSSMRHDGLIVVKPKRRVFWGYPFKMLLALFVGFFVFKGLMLASLGDITYNERVAKLHQGSAVERGGAWVMQIDPATKFLSGFIAPYIR